MGVRPLSPLHRPSHAARRPPSRPPSSPGGPPPTSPARPPSSPGSPSTTLSARRCCVPATRRCATPCATLSAIPPPCPAAPTLPPLASPPRPTRALPLRHRPEPPRTRRDQRSVPLPAFRPHLRPRDLPPHRCPRDLGTHPPAPRAAGRRAGWWGMNESAEAFLDQLVTWRELGFKRCLQVAKYDSCESLPEGARRTLREHASDPREWSYDRDAFEEARTHDPLLERRAEPAPARGPDSQLPADALGQDPLHGRPPGQRPCP